MNMFEMHDFLLDSYRKEEGPGTPVIPAVETIKPQGAMDDMTAGAPSNSQTNPFPTKKVLITAGTIVLVYFIFEALSPKNNTSYAFSERRRLARQRNTK